MKKWNIICQILFENIFLSTSVLILNWFIANLDCLDLNYIPYAYTVAVKKLKKSGFGPEIQHEFYYMLYMNAGLHISKKCIEVESRSQIHWDIVDWSEADMWMN